LSLEEKKLSERRDFFVVTEKKIQLNEKFFVNKKKFFIKKRFKNCKFIPELKIYFSAPLGSSSREWINNRPVLIK